MEIDAVTEMTRWKFAFYHLTIKTFVNIIRRIKMNIESLKLNLTSFFSTAFEYEISNDICEITTPFLDGHNDNIIIYLTKEKDNNYKLSDGGYIKFESNAKNIPMFMGQTKFTNEDEVYAIVNEKKLPNALIDLATLIIIITNQYLMNRLVRSEKN